MKWLKKKIGFRVYLEVIFEYETLRPPAVMPETPARFLVEGRKQLRGSSPNWNGGPGEIEIIFTPVPSAEATGQAG